MKRTWAWDTGRLLKTGKRKADKDEKEENQTSESRELPVTQ